MKILLILITMPIAYKTATRWVDFEEDTCLDEWDGKWNKPGPKGIGGQKLSKIFVGVGKEDCKKKCVDYNMDETQSAKEYPCRAIEWSDQYKIYQPAIQEWVTELKLKAITTVCHLRFKMGHRFKNGKPNNSNCKDWQFSLIWSEDIKGSGWTSDCTLKMVNYRGHDLYQGCEKAESYKECRERCQGYGACGFWTYVVSDPWFWDMRLSGICCLKDYDAESSISDQPSSCTGVCFYSGPKNCGENKDLLQEWEIMYGRWLR